MKIAITGAGGLIGSNLARHFARQHELVLLKHGDLDITDRAAVRRRMLEERPSLIINCALLDVDECERDPEKGKAVNSDGPRSLAEAASESGAEFVNFSSNYVFDGRQIGRAPYTIHDEPHPINTYGITKLAGDEGITEACSRTYVIRTAWVYGRGKKSFLCVVHDDLAAGRQIRAIPDLWANTTYVADLARRVEVILGTGRYGTYHVVNEGICSYYEFAMEAGYLIGLSRERLEGLIEVVKEDEMRRAAARPRYTPMRCLLSEELGLPPLRDWRTALADYVREKSS